MWRGVTSARNQLQSPSILVSQELVVPPPCSPTLPEQHWGCKLPPVSGRSGRLWVSYMSVNNKQTMSKLAASWYVLVLDHRIYTHVKESNTKVLYFSCTHSQHLWWWRHPVSSVYFTASQSLWSDTAGWDGTAGDLEPSVPPSSGRFTLWTITETTWFVSTTKMLCQGPDKLNAMVRLYELGLKGKKRVFISDVILKTSDRGIFQFSRLSS